MKKLTLLLITLCILITTVYAYNLTTIVNGNKLTATVNSGENVSLEYDDVDGYTFDGWSTTGVTLTNPTSKNTSFTMPANDVTIEPNMSLSHVHSYSEATCTVPPTCSCGATNGSALGHSWNNATCTTAKTCSVCSAIEGNALGHSWNNATCTKAKTCSVCGTTEGNALGHESARICNVNGSTDTVQCVRYGSGGCTSTQSQECTHTYTLTVTQATGGTITLSATSVKAGGSAIVTIAPSSGWSISDVKVNGTSVGAKTSYTISNIISNQTITANYEVDKTTIPVGSYVTYRPSSISYKVYETDTGNVNYDEDTSDYQEFNPSATTSWRVMYNNSGQLDIVSTDELYTVDGYNLSLYGKIGYAKAVSTLNAIGNAYVHSTYATSGRHIGSTSSSTGTISESSIVHGVSVFPYTDELYTTDVNQLINNNMLANDVTWLASRNMHKFSDNTAFYVGEFYSDGDVLRNRYALYYAGDDGSSRSDSNSSAVRPIVTLKPTIRITSGNGTQESPYVIN